MERWAWDNILFRPVLLRVEGMFDHDARPKTFEKVLYDALGRPVVLVTDQGVHYRIAVITSWEFVK